MCGISGIYERGQSDIDRNRVLAMRARMTHRGPDDEGAFFGPHVGLGFNRLSIIDLSDSGHQPMMNDDGSVALAFNGEVYNFLELRPRLEERGHVFTSRSDTEVILRGYEEWGTEVFSYLNGMFALAIWDTRRERLILARDRLGKKPVFYRDQAGEVVFASEVQALLAGLETTPPVDPRAMDAYLTYACVPGEMSIFEGVRKLPPAHFAVFDKSGATLSRYWDVSFREKARGSEEELLEELDELLDDATRIRMISDVPLGAFLSGGVDSSAVVAHMCRFSERVRTFSIGFSDEEFNELPHAAAVAQACGTQHEEFVVEPEAAKILPRLVWHYGEPFADSSAIPTYYVAQLARTQVTVALNGDGGDEAFAGYNWCRNEAVLGRYRRAIPGMIRRWPLRALGAAFRRLPGRPAHMAHVLLEHGAQTVPEAHWIWAPWVGAARDHLYTSAWRDRLDGYHPQRLVRDMLRTSSGDGDLDQTLDAALRSYLPDDLLVKVDIASMANSLEPRSPILDHRIIEFAARLPAHFKVRGFTTRYLLKRHTAQLVPPHTVFRGKRGFSVPLAAWLRGPLRPALESILLHPRALERGYFRPEALRQVVGDFLQGRTKAHLVWMLLWLELWHLIFIDRVIDRDTDLTSLS